MTTAGATWVGEVRDQYKSFSWMVCKIKHQEIINYQGEQLKRQFMGDREERTIAETCLYASLWANPGFSFLRAAKCSLINLLYMLSSRGSLSKREECHKLWIKIQHEFI